MSFDRLEIESLVLRVPGITPADARVLAAEVATELQRRLQTLDGVGHVELGALRLQLPANASRARWPELIADRLVASLAEARHGG
jgi:hypothetical protein